MVESFSRTTHVPWRDCRDIDVKFLISAWNTRLNNVLHSKSGYLEEVSLLPDACNQWHMLCSSVARFTFCKSQLIVEFKTWISAELIFWSLHLSKLILSTLERLFRVHFCLSLNLFVGQITHMFLFTCNLYDMFDFVPYSCWRIVHAMSLSLFVDNTSSHLVSHYLSLPAFTNEYLFLFHIRVWIRTKPM